MITELSLVGLLATARLVLSVAILMTAGIAASWSFGREFVDDALPALSAIATPGRRWPRQSSSYWPVTVVSTVTLTVIGGLLVGLDMDSTALQTASRDRCRRAIRRDAGRTNRAGLKLAATCQDSSPCWPWWS
jgi:hypothetical protein